MKVTITNFLKLMLINLNLYLRYTQQVIKISVNQYFDLSSNQDLQGSFYGGTRLWLRGQGFDSVDYNNQIFIGTTPCVIQDYFTTETQLSCLVSEGVYSQQVSQNLPITVYSKNKKLDCNTNCNFAFYLSHSPFIRAFIPNALVAGETLGIKGFHYADNTADIEEILIGDGYQCNFELDENGRDLNGGDANEVVECTVGDEVAAGDYKVRYRIKERAGYAKVLKSGRTWDYNTGEEYHVRVYPKITSVSQSEGFVTGSYLDILGQGFGEDKNAVNVEIDDFDRKLDLEILEVTNSKIRVRVNEDKRQAPVLTKVVYLGGTGYVHNFSKNNESDVYSIKLVPESNPLVTYYQQTYTGIFKAPESGNYKFRIASDDHSEVRLAKATFDVAFQKDDIPVVCSQSSFTDFRDYFKFYTYTDASTCQAELVKDEYYYIWIFHRQYGGPGYLTVSMEIPYIKQEPIRVNTKPPITEMEILYDPIPEVIQIKILNAVGGKFQVLFQEKNQNGDFIVNFITDKIAYNATADELRQAIRDKYNYWYMAVTKEYLNSSAQVTTEESEISGSLYTLTFNRKRPHNAIPFIVTADLSGAAVASAERTQEGTPDVRGSFTISVNGNNVTFNYSDQQQDVLNRLRMLENVAEDGVTVARNGDGYKQFKWDIIWDGFANKELEVLLVENNITGGSESKPATLTVNQLEQARDDYLFYYQIPPELVRSLHDKPQVKVSVNNRYSVCEKTICDYSILPLEGIPTVSNWSLTNLELSLTISNQELLPNFQWVKDNLSIKLGNGACEISDITMPTITCQMEQNQDGTALIEAGDLKPEVYLKNLGFLQVTNSQTFNLEATSITPNQGSLGGQQSVTIVGKGFSQSAEVLINDLTCVVQTVTNIKIICKTPPSATEGTFTVKVNQGSLNNQTLTYEYLSSLTPTITQLNPASSSPVLKKDLVITGSGFGTDQSLIKVYLKPNDQTIAESLCNIKAISDTEITCRLSGGKTGDYVVRINHSSNGDSIAAGTDANFRYEIIVTDYSPKEGSLKGGTFLTVTGQNFSESLLDNQVQIAEGEEAIFCLIKTATSTQLTCQMQQMKKQEQAEQSLNFYVTGKIVELAACTNCKYKFTDSKTPKVTALNLNSLKGGDTFTITGTNLKGADSTLITLENEDRTQEISSFTTHTTESIEFAFPNFPAGTYTLKVLIKDLGYAEFSEGVSVQITNQLIVSSITPNTGNIGGQKVSVQGFGFSETDKIFITNECLDLNFISSTEIQCTVPPLNLLSAQNEVKVKSLTQEVQCSCSYTTLAEKYALTDFNSLIFTDSDSVVVQFTITDNIIPLEGTIQASLRNQNQRSLLISGTVSNFSTNPQAVFTNVPVGTYNLELFDTSIGFVKIEPADQALKITFGNQTLQLTDNQSSYFGKSTFTLTGKGFPSTEHKALTEILVCGKQAEIVTSNYNQLTILTPLIKTEQIVQNYNLSDNEILTPVQVLKTNGSNSENVNDGDFTTYFSGSAGCTLTFDFGENHKAKIEMIRIFPRLGEEPVALGDTIEGSQDGTTFTELTKLEENLIENWNEFVAPEGQTWQYRFVRYSGQRCRIAEFQVRGILTYQNFSTDLTSNSCDLQLKQEGEIIDVENAVEYRQDLTPSVTSVTPSLGPTSGNTNIIITGQNFNACSVTIDKITCNITSQTQTQINCTTGARPTLTTSSFVVLCQNGLANSKADQYLYIDRWSDSATWGGELPPQEGESVFVPVGQSLLVDVSTPKLRLINIEGSMIFEDVNDLTLDAHYIVVKGGLLQAGTPQQRRQNKLTITLHGVKADQALPMMGNKLIGNIGGTVDLHGKYIENTWTMLKTSANVGDTTIEVIDDISDWETGATIVIASTTQSQEEFEERVITAINGKVITLDKPLLYAHYAEVETFDGKEYALRAEVGLLTRNIKIQGDESTLTTRHGFHIMMVGRNNSVTGRFSYIELTRAGQVFHMGRYPIHFHLTGNCIGSYIEGVAVHKAFNRCTTFHGVHYLSLTKSVYFDNLGHCIFIEDSIESRNIISRNLVMKTKISSSLLMSDLKASCFWITRPLNYFSFNHAVNSQKFGFWFDLPNNPTGPSSTSTICPVGERLGLFKDNTSHGSQIGIRVYPQYKPLTNPCGSLKNINAVDITADNPPLKPVFEGNLVYGNGTGFFGRNVGALIIRDLVNISNSNSFTFMEPEYEVEEFYPLVENAVVVGKSGFSSSKTSLFLDSTRKHGVKFENVKIINFENSVLVKACHACDPSGTKNGMGMAPTVLSGLSFINSSFSRFIQFTAPEIGKDLIIDKDGSLFSQIGMSALSPGYITPYFEHLLNSNCQISEDVSICSDKCLICPESVKIQRLDIRRTDSLMNGYTLKIFDLTNREGFTDELTTNDPFGIIDFQYLPNYGFRGWTIPVLVNNEYNIHWNDGFVFRNIEIADSVPWGNSDFVRTRFNVTGANELYDISYTGLDQSNTRVSNVLIPHVTSDLSLSQKFGESIYNKESKKLTINIGGQRGKVKVTEIFCREFCPEEPDQVEEESEFRYWSKKEDWELDSVPLAGQDAVIKAGWKMVMDIPSTPILNSLTINGSLIFQEDLTLSSYELNAKRIYVSNTGSLLAGDSQKPFTKKLNINLHGTQQDTLFVISPTVQPSNKLFLITGKVQIYATTPSISTTKLQQSLLKNTMTINVKEQVNWSVGDMIAISSTSQNWQQDEKHEISAINGNIITLKAPAQYNHYGSSTLVKTKLSDVDMSAEVSLLTRRVVIRGVGDDWGCHVHVVGYTGITSGEALQGQIQLHGVQVDNCGQKDTDKAALDFRDLNDAQKQNTIEKCSITNSLGWGVGAINASYIDFNDSVVYNSLKNGVYLRNIKNINFQRNNVMKVRERPWYSNASDFDIIMGVYIEGDLNYVAQSVFIKDNISSGTPWFAWAVPGYSCTQSVNNFHNNVGHSSRAGWLPSTAGTCQRYSDFTAYRNFEQGFANRFMTHELRVFNFILIDNHNAISMNGGATTKKDSPKATLQNSVIIGKALKDCDFCYDNQIDCETNGIYTSLFESENFELRFNEYRLPLHNSTFSNYLWGGTQLIEKVSFSNFAPSIHCTEEKAFVIRTNNFVQDTSVYVTMRDNTLEDVNHVNKFFFANHTRLKHPSFCSKRDCTGIYNLILDDVSGNFDLSNKPLQYFGYNKEAGADGNCTFVEAWNGHQCEQSFALLSVKKTFQDRSPIITPMYLSEFLNPPISPKVYSNTVDNETEIPAIVKLNGYNLVRFSQSMPNNNIYRFDYSNSAEWSVFRTVNQDSSTLVTLVRGVRTPSPLILPETGKMDWTQHKNNCGAYVYYPKQQAIEWVMTSSPTCIVTIQQIKSIKASVRLDIPLQDFYNANGVTKFIDNLSALLGIQPSQIKIVGISEGSAIVDFVIESLEANVGEANNENQQLTGINNLLKEKIGDFQVDGFKVLDFTSEVQLPEETAAEFLNQCRFYSGVEVFLIDGYVKDYELRQENLNIAYVDVDCDGCKVTDCLAKLPEACKANANVFKNGECGSIDNIDNESFGQIFSIFALILWILF